MTLNIGWDKSFCFSSRNWQETSDYFDVILNGKRLYLAVKMLHFLGGISSWKRRSSLKGLNWENTHTHTHIHICISYLFHTPLFMPNCLTAHRVLTLSAWVVSWASQLWLKCRLNWSGAWRKHTAVRRCVRCHWFTRRPSSSVWQTHFCYWLIFFMLLRTSE